VVVVSDKEIVGYLCWRESDDEEEDEDDEEEEEAFLRAAMANGECLILKRLFEMM
jgi:hypothetical protein